MSRILVTPRSLTRSPDHVAADALRPLVHAGHTLVFGPSGVLPDEDTLRRLLPGCVGWLCGIEPVSARVEKAMVYAITRQESAFQADAQSSAGARGLMQLMPDTARRTAKRFGVEFELGRLLDPAYNAKLGSAHLGELMDDWKGSHILMFASYNAGGGNVAKSTVCATRRG